MKASEIRGKVDFAIITVREDEFAAVLERFPNDDTALGERIYSLSHLQTDRSEEGLVAITRCHEQGEGEGQSVASDLIFDLQPKCILVVGIAGGVPSDDFTLGDVVVATRLHDFSVRASIQGTPDVFSVTGGPMHKSIQNIASFLPAMDVSLKGWNDPDSIGMSTPPVDLDPRNFYGDANWRTKVKESLERHFSGTSRKPASIVGPIASSDTLVKNAELIIDWQKAARHLLAVEMELGGIYRASRRIDREYPILAIRGISDIVGYKRHPDWTKFACKTAAAFTHALLKALPFKELLSINSDNALAVETPRTQRIKTSDRVIRVIAHDEKIYLLGKGKSTIGRGQEADISIPTEDAASLIHFGIAWDDIIQTHVVEDYGNNTRISVNNIVLPKQATWDLVIDDVIRLGRTALRYELLQRT